MDVLARASTPHERMIRIPLSIALVLCVVWILFGNLDHNLWIQQFSTVNESEMPGPEIFSDNGEVILGFNVILHQDDVSFLSPGHPVFVLSKHDASTSVKQGSIVRIDTSSSRSAHRVICRIGAEGLIPSENLADYYQLRVPLGSLSPYEYLTRLLQSIPPAESSST